MFETVNSFRVIVRLRGQDRSDGSQRLCYVLVSIDRSPIESTLLCTTSESLERIGTAQTHVFCTAYEFLALLDPHRSALSFAEVETHEQRF